MTAEPAVGPLHLTAALEGPLERPPGRLQRLLEPPALALAVACALAVVYLLWSPLAPDISAQTARASAARLTHMGTWWTGWFGGLSLASYSVVVPPVMALLGVPVTGALAVVATAAAGGRLLHGAVRPRTGAIALSVAAAADVLGGRTTFAIGTAAALAAALALQRDRRLLAAGLGVLTVLCSPLAGLFLGIAAAALFIVRPHRRRGAAVICGSLGATALALALKSPGTGQMPFTARDLAGAAAATAAVAILCPQRLVRVGAALLILAEVLCFLVPSAVGVNVGRLTAVFGAAAVLAFSPRHRAAAALAAIGLTIGPCVDLVNQIHAGHDASARHAFYQPLVDQLVAHRGLAGPVAAGQRVEVIDPRTHGEAGYVAPIVPLARGWYRQADVADNGIFYQQDALTPTSYRRWLDSLAVRWVALPNAPLDYASVAEARLVRSGLPYLTPIWSNSSWTLYEVDRSKPLADGAAAAFGGRGLTVHVPHAGVTYLRVRWSPAIALESPTGVDGARTFDADGWVGLETPDPGTYVLTARDLL